MTPAFYVIRSDRLLLRHVNALHWPFSLWHLSYVVLGVALAQERNLAVLGWLVLAFAGGMVLAAHHADLLAGDPLRQAIPKYQLRIGVAVGLITGSGIGVWLVLSNQIPPWLFVTVPLGVLFAAGYGLEWPGFHGDAQFASFWAVFPFLVGYFSQGSVWAWHLIPAVFFVYATAIVQRELSTRARFIRRKIAGVEGQYVRIGKTAAEPITAEWMIGPLERALAGLSVALPLLAGGLLLWR